MLARMNDVKCWYWYIVFLSHNFGPHSRSDNNKPLFVIVRFTSSIKTATHKFHNKKINIQIKTAKPNGEDLLQANIQFGFAYWLHDSYMDFKNPSNRLLWWFFYFLKGIPKWFLSNPKHQLLQTNTHTQITKQMRTIHHVEWEIIMEHRNTKHTHTHTEWIALNVIILIFFEVVRILLWFCSLYYVFSHLLQMIHRIFNQQRKDFLLKKYITLAEKRKTTHLCLLWHSTQYEKVFKSATEMFQK